MTSLSAIFLVLCSYVLCVLQSQFVEASKSPTFQPTSIPTSQAPTSYAPTNIPTSQVPTSQVPTSVPTSQAPTGIPTSQAPTSVPTSQAPTSQPSRSCSICAAGQFYNINLASGGSVNTVVGCTSCLPGYTCAGGCNDPQPCAIGKYNGLYGALSCTSCAAGTYSTVSAATSCTNCPGGYSCASTTAGERHFTNQ